MKSPKTKWPENYRKIFQVSERFKLNQERQHSAVGVLHVKHVAAPEQ